MKTEEIIRQAKLAREGGITHEDYEEALDSHRALVKQIDTALFGENAAKQASLCDLVPCVIRVKAASDKLLAAIKEIHKEATRHKEEDRNRIIAIYEIANDALEFAAGISYYNEAAAKHVLLRAEHATSKEARP